MGKINVFKVLIGFFVIFFVLVFFLNKKNIINGNSDCFGRGKDFEVYLWAEGRFQDQGKSMFFHFPVEAFNTFGVDLMNPVGVEWGKTLFRDDGPKGLVVYEKNGKICHMEFVLENFSDKVDYFYMNGVAYKFSSTAWNVFYPYGEAPEGPYKSMKQLGYATERPQIYENR